MSQRDRIKVVCRIRPENKLEKEGSYQKCVTFDKTNIAVSVNIEQQQRANHFTVQPREQDE